MASRNLPTSTVSEVDDLDTYLDEQLADPAFAASFEDAALRARLVADLVRCRKAQGLKQRDVAAHMGVAQSVVSQFENGGGDAFLSTLQRYARALGARVTTRIEMPAQQSWAEHVNRRGYTTTAPTVRPTEGLGAREIKGLREWTGAARRSSAIAAA